MNYLTETKADMFSITIMCSYDSNELGPKKVSETDKQTHRQNIHFHEHTRMHARTHHNSTYQEQQNYQKIFIKEKKPEPVRQLKKKKPTTTKLQISGKKINQWKLICQYKIKALFVGNSPNNV
jgi:hypothetical protein